MWGAILGNIFVSCHGDDQQCLEFGPVFDCKPVELLYKSHSLGMKSYLVVFCTHIWMYREITADALVLTNDDMYSQSTKLCGKTANPLSYFGTNFMSCSGAINSSNYTTLCFCKTVDMCQINSLLPSDVRSLVNIGSGNGLVPSKPVPESILTYCQLSPLVFIPGYTRTLKISIPSCDWN